MDGVSGPAGDRESIDLELRPLFDDIESEKVASSSDNDLAIFPENTSSQTTTPDEPRVSNLTNEVPKETVKKASYEIRRAKAAREGAQEHVGPNPNINELRKAVIDELKQRHKEDEEGFEPETTVNVHGKPAELRDDLTMTKNDNGQLRKWILSRIYSISVTLLAFGGGFVAMAVVILTWPVSLPVVAIAMTAVYLATAGAQYKYLSNVIAKKEQGRLEQFGPSYNDAINKSPSFEQFAENERIKKHLDKKNDGSKGEAAIFHYSPYIRGDARHKILDMNKDLERLKELEQQKKDLQPQPNQTALASADDELSQIEKELDQVKKRLEDSFKDFKDKHSSFTDTVMDREKLESLQYGTVQAPPKAQAFLASVAEGVASVWNSCRT